MRQRRQLKYDILRVGWFANTHAKSGTILPRWLHRSSEYFCSDSRVRQFRRWTDQLALAGIVRPYTMEAMHDQRSPSQEAQGIPKGKNNCQHVAYVRVELTWGTRSTKVCSRVQQLNHQKALSHRRTLPKPFTNRARKIVTARHKSTHAFSSHPLDLKSPLELALRSMCHAASEVVDKLMPPMCAKLRCRLCSDALRLDLSSRQRGSQRQSPQC